MIEISRATIEHLPELVPLFDQYRVFYEQESDEKAAEKFLKQRIEKDETVVFLARVNGKAAGFTQLFTTFSSVSMQPMYVLNDLYVNVEFRKLGVGQLLLKKAKEHCLEKGYKGLALETATDNPAQKLYERLNWKKDTHCFHYFWTAAKEAS